MVSQAEKYKVKTPVFEGPLEALLNLVEERKLFINEISLTEVTDDYLNYVRELQEKGETDMLELTGFIVVAATLVLIKSKSLLPGLKLSSEEEGQIGDLETRLRLYQAVKKASQPIKSLFGRQIIFGRPEGEAYQAVFAPDPAITAENMISAIRGVIEAMPKKEFLPEVAVKKVISIEEMIGSLAERIQKSLSVSFSELSAGRQFETPREQRVYVIVSFLAMLELVRTGAAEVIQAGNFSEIEIRQYKEETQTV